MTRHVRQFVERYGVFGTLRLALEVIRTRMFYPSARLVRSPFRIRGRRYVDFGSGLTTGTGVRIDALPTMPKTVLFFGRNVQLNDHVHIGAIDCVRIGDDVLIASRVFIADHNHGGFEGLDPSDSPDVAPSERPLKSKPVIVGDRVWIGEGVCILPGVTIGRGSVIGAGAVVTRDVPAECVAVGNPARVVKRYDRQARQWLRT